MSGSILGRRYKRGVVLIAKYSNTVTWNLQTKYDGAGIVKMEAALDRMAAKIDVNRTKFQSITLGGDKLDADKTIAQIRRIQDAFTNAYSARFKMYDVSALQKELNGLNLNEFMNQLSSGQTGIQGLSTQASQFMTRFINGAGKINTELRSVSTTVERFTQSFFNTARWGLTAAAFQGIMNSIRGSVEYIKELDTSLSNIRVVTDLSSNDMKSYAEYANQAAQALGISTVAFTDAAQLYAQNGYNIEDQQRLAELTNKVANVTQADVVATSEHITALINGYQLSIDEAEKALDGMALVAAESASDLDELATAQERVASTAHMLGVSQEQLTSQISTIVSVTRQAPESVGTALRTLYSRFADIELGETLEDGVNLGDFSSELEKVGVRVLDMNGELRSMGDIVEDLMRVWGQLSTTQQQALGNVIAGKRQTNMLAALLENPEMYQQQLEMAENAAGTVDKQQSIRMESLEAKMNSMSAAAEGLWSSLIDSDGLKSLVDTLTEILNLINSIVKSIGGGGNVAGFLMSSLIRGGSRQIGESIQNMQYNRMQTQMANANMANFRDLMISQGATANADGTLQFDMQNSPILGGSTTELVNTILRGFKNREMMNPEEAKQWQADVDEMSRQIAQGFYHEKNFLANITQGSQEISQKYQEAVQATGKEIFGSPEE